MTIEMRLASPCILRARTVATITAALGLRPLYRHLMFMNFSQPMSEPKPEHNSQIRKREKPFRFCVLKTYRLQ